MKERPILFSAPMVRALLAGTKTQTRRVVKARADRDMGPRCVLRPHELAGEVNGGDYRNSYYGQPGDRLWVRETFAIPDRRAENLPAWVYAADYADRPQHPWKPSIHMPRAASRITLEIISIRVERLQDISEADAIAEGCTQLPNGYYRGGPHKVSGMKQMATAVRAYRDLWESINGAGSWDANPWVWAVEFKRLEGGAA